MIDPNIDKFIGKGLTFPIELDQYGKAVLKNGLELLESDLKVLMNWPYGTRFFEESYGTKLEEFLEEPNDVILQTEINHFVTEAIRTWEKRVVVGRVEYTRIKDATGVYIKIPCGIAKTKFASTFIVPYYSVLNP